MFRILREKIYFKRGVKGLPLRMPLMLKNAIKLEGGVGAGEAIKGH